MAPETTVGGGFPPRSASATAVAGGAAAERPVVVRLEGVEKTYAGGVVGVVGADLAIGAGEFLTLLGPSGCGKTTTLRLIAGFERPTAGRITVAGRDVTMAAPYDRPVNTVFQDYALFPHMTVAENVRFGLEVARVPAAEAGRRSRAALEMVGLADKEAARPATLSGGQRQRVALARAIVNEPAVLLLDEPLAALDAHLREQMQVELKRLQARLGTTFVMVTHDQTEALSISDRIVVMNRGRIEQVADPATLYDRPATRFVAGFIGAMNLVPGRVRAVSAAAVLVEAGGLVVEAEAIGVDVVPGAAVTLGLRPEDVRVAPAGEGTAARIDGVVFHGRTVRLHLILADGTAIKADLARGSTAAAALGPGSVVGIVALGAAKIYPGE